MLKIIALCANGMGTSSLIERKVQGIMDALGVEATVTHASLGTGKTKAKGYQIVLCSNAFVGDIEAADLGDTKVIGVKNLMSDKEIEKKMKEYMDDKGSINTILRPPHSYHS